MLTPLRLSLGMGRLVFFVIGLSIFVALVAPSSKYHARDASAATTNAGGSNDTNVVASSGSNGQLFLERNATGQFATDVSVNGQWAPFVVDTGADMVALTIDDARRLGVQFDQAHFSVVGSGASGAVKGENVIIDRIEIAGHTLDHVQAAVIEGLDQNLLGQTVLKRLNGVELTGDRLVLR